MIIAEEKMIFPSDSIDRIRSYIDIALHVQNPNQIVVSEDSAEQHTVDAIQEAAVAGHDVSRIFDPRLTFEERFRQITERRGNT